MMRRLNYDRVFITVIMFLGVNYYFGWNMFPESDAEMLCDCLVGLAAMISITGSTVEEVT